MALFYHAIYTDQFYHINMLQLYKQVKAFIHVTARKYEGYAEIEDLEQEQLKEVNFD